MSSLFGFFKASPAPLLHLITAPPFRRPAQAALEACLNSPISFHLPLTRCSVRLHLLATSHFHCLHAVNVADALLRLEPQLVEVETQPDQLGLHRRTFEAFSDIYRSPEQVSKQGPERLRDHDVDHVQPEDILVTGSIPWLDASVAVGLAHERTVPCHGVSPPLDDSVSYGIPWETFGAPLEKAAALSAGQDFVSQLVAELTAMRHMDAWVPRLLPALVVGEEPFRVWLTELKMKCPRLHTALFTERGAEMARTVVRNVSNFALKHPQKDPLRVMVVLTPPYAVTLRHILTSTPDVEALIRNPF